MQLDHSLRAQIPVSPNLLERSDFFMYFMYDFSDELNITLLTNYWLQYFETQSQ
jgi:hypothetical protein